MHERGKHEVAASEDGDGCLIAAIRLPVRIVALLIVLPLRLAWDVLAAVGRTLNRYLLAPLGRAVAWLLYRVLVVPAAALYRYVLAPAGRAVAWVLRLLGAGLLAAARGLGAALAWLGRWLLVLPAAVLYRYVLAPVGRGIAWVLAALVVGVVWLARVLVVVPAVALCRWVLVPVGRAVVWTLRMLVLVPVVALWRYVLVPVGRELWAALVWAWRIAGYVSRAVGRALRWLGRVLVVLPVRWAWRNAVHPVGRFVRRELWWPVKETLRAARADVRRALFGSGGTAMTHRSRAYAVLIDTPREDAPSAAAFWAAALGAPAHGVPGEEQFTVLAADAVPGLVVAVQAVDDAPRFHIDVETDDVEAETARLLALGAVEVSRWLDCRVLRAPGGHLVCVIPVHSEAGFFAERARAWT